MKTKKMYNLFLDLLMSMKAEKIENESNGEISRFKYYNIKDKEFILYKLHCSSAKKIWRIIKESIYEEGDSGLSSKICPFCIQFDYECENCPYSETHGNCYKKGSKNSDFHQILLHFKNDNAVLPNEWYRNVIEKIEKMIKIKED